MYLFFNMPPKNSSRSRGKKEEGGGGGKKEEGGGEMRSEVKLRSDIIIEELGRFGYKRTLKAGQLLNGFTNQINAVTSGRIPMLSVLIERTATDETDRDVDTPFRMIFFSKQYATGYSSLNADPNDNEKKTCLDAILNINASNAIHIGYTGENANDLVMVIVPVMSYMIMSDPPTIDELTERGYLVRDRSRSRSRDRKSLSKDSKKGGGSRRASVKQSGKKVGGYALRKTNKRK